MANALQYPGQFEIEQIVLITSKNIEVDLSASVVALTLYEDIFSTTVTGELLIQDSVNLASTGPLIGQEYLKLKIRTPTFQDKSAIIDFSENAFIVHSVMKRERANDNSVQVTALSFVSQELVKNQRLKVTKSLEGTWSQIVKKMLVNEIKTKKDIIIEPSSGLKKFIAPNMRPLDIIVLAAKQAISETRNEPTYLFYETLKGFNFRTLGTLYNEPTQMEYTTAIAGAHSPHGHADVAVGLRTVISYEIVSNNDSLVNYRTGVYGSTLITHDIVGKKWTKNIYHYHNNFPDEHHIVRGGTAAKKEFPIASALAVSADGKTVSDFPARTFLMPTSLNGLKDSQHQTDKSTFSFMAYDPQKWVQRRNSQMIQLENAYNVNISVHGNTLINPGDKIILNLPNISAVKSDEKDDKFYKGPFLIKRIRHDFNMATTPRKHEMSMNLVKDSLEEELGAGGSIEPEASSSVVTNYTWQYPA